MSYIKRAGDLTVTHKQMFDGDGEVISKKLLDGAEAMYGKGRVFNHVTLEPGVSLGWHIHHGDGETYYVLRGKGEYNDNGTVVEIGPGDVTFTDDGEGHAVKNTGDEPLEYIALILYK